LQAVTSVFLIVTILLNYFFFLAGAPLVAAAA